MLGRIDPKIDYELNEDQVFQLRMKPSVGYDKGKVCFRVRSLFQF
jgi:hypothetical protein